MECKVSHVRIFPRAIQARFASNVTIIIFAALLSACTTMSSSDSKAATGDQLVAVAIANLKARSNAIVTQDREIAKAILSDNFEGVGFNGRTVGRDTWIDIHFPTEPGFTRFEPSIISAKALCAEHIVLTGQMFVETIGAIKGPSQSRLSQFSSSVGAIS